MKACKFFICLLLPLACLVAASPAQADVAGYVQFVNGDVQITNPAGQTRPAQKGDAINEGDTLTSAQKASAQIRMQDGGIVAVRPETKLKFDQFVFAGKEDGSEKSFFSLFKGGFRAVTGLIGRINKQNYRITTPAATIGIRGTDHETFVITPDSPLAQVAPTGAYNKVNIGETYVATEKGTIFVQPNQMGFAGGMDQMPQLQPINTKVFTVAEAAAPGAKAEKKEEEKAEAKQEEKVAEGDKKEEKKEEAQKEEAKAETAAEGGTAGEAAESGTAAEAAPVTGTATQEEVAPVRETAVVDAAPPSTGGAPAATATVTVTTTAAAQVIAPPPATTTTLTTTTATGGTTVNITTGTATTAGGQTIPVTQSVAATQAQAAADAALVAATAAQAAAVAAAQADTTLAGIATVAVAPATTAIGTATADIGAADTAVTAAAALAPADAAAATANATSAQATADAAAAQAAAAQAALTASGAFADSTADPANTSVQSANGALQTANATVQTAATDVAVQNTALGTAQGTAAAALASANTNLATANTSLTAADTQNTAITTAQASTPAQVTAAQTAAANAQAAAIAAQAAATQAATLQTAGDLVGAQGQLTIAQQQLAIAQTEQANAQTAQTVVDTHLANAQAAQTAATTAVTDAQAAANTAASGATTASTEAAAAQTAASSAAAALAQTDPTVVSPTLSAAHIVQANSDAIVANAPIAAYNNPAVVTADRFVGLMSTVQPDTVGGSGYVEGYGPGAGFNGIGTANTSFVLDGSGNLVESRHAWYEETPASSAAPQIVVADANVTHTGGLAVETFKMADNSIYAGRWVGGTITVSDNIVGAPPIPTFTRNLGVTSEHWAILLAPPAGYVQTLVGTVTYDKVAATSPTDALGNAGQLINASLTANFTSQVVDAALNLTIAGKTLDIVAAGMAITGSFFSTDLQVTATCTGCGAATYYANVGGGFAGDAAASAGVNYTLWTGAAPGAATGATNLIQGIVAFSATTTPTQVPQPPAVAGNLPAWPDLYAYEVVATEGAPGAYLALNPWDELLANTVYGLDATNNLVEVNRQPQLGNREYFSGGAAQDTWVAPDGSVYMGRWQGGNITTVDYLGGLVGTVALGAGSAHWIVSAQTPAGYVQTLTGLATYTLSAATAPTDALGNAGTLLNTSTVTADFTAQLVNMVLNVEFAGARTSAFTVTTPGGIAVLGETVWGTGTVACTGANCDAGGYSADLWARFAGSTASTAALAYHIVATSMTDIIQGAAAFGSTGVVQLLPYIATNTAVAYTGSFGGGFNFVAAPGDVSPAGNPTSFTETYGSGSGARTDTLVGATTATPPTTVTTTAGTQVTYGVWESVSSVAISEQRRIEPDANGRSLPTYMYGGEGYLDSAVVFGTNTGPLAGVYGYTSVAATSFQSDTWATGSVTTATLNANFTTQTISIALAGTMGANNWAATSTNLPISFMSPATGTGARFSDSAPVVTLNATACATCGGNINGAFVGQNYAGAIVQYSIWDNSPLVGMNAGGLVAFSRDAAVADGAPAPTNTFVVANSWQVDSPSTITIDGAGVLTGWSGAGWNSAVAPAAGSVAQAAVGTGSGTINLGTWADGSVITSSSSYMPGPGQFHWITAPEPTPVYLAEVLTTVNAQYNLVGGDVTSLTGGVHGTIGTASLTANFTTQTVAVNLALAVNGHNWAASTPDAPLQSLNNNSMTGFDADSTRPSVQTGYLTVTVDGQPGGNGSLTGQLVGAALDGAILKFNLDGAVTTPTAGYEFVQGVAALEAAAANDPATPYRLIATAMSDPTALVPTVIIGGSYNNTARVITDGSGNLTQFDDSSGGKGTTIQYVSGGFADQGSAVIGGATVSWGRWAPGSVVTATDRATGVSQNFTLTSGAHAVVGPLMTGPVELPVAGVYGYTMVGATTPTTDAGTAGTLNSTSLQANFTTQTVNVGVNVTAAGATLDALASNVPIQNRAIFYTDSRMTGAGALAVTCTGACGTTNHGAIGGGFGGPGGAGAAVTYGFEKGGVNAGTVSGVAVFQQGAPIP